MPIGINDRRLSGGGRRERQCRHGRRPDDRHVSIIDGIDTCRKSTCRPYRFVTPVQIIVERVEIEQKKTGFSKCLSFKRVNNKNVLLLGSWVCTSAAVGFRNP